MVIFDDDEFEIAIATYKRSEFIQKWLEKCYEPAMERSIKLSIYDSSPDIKTKEVVEKFNKDKRSKVQYHHVDEKTIIGYKPMIPILESTSKYLWISGDSKCHDFGELDEKVFPYIKDKSVDYIVMNTANNYRMPDTLFDDKSKMIHSVFVASTCIGLSIYRTAIFDPIKKNASLLQQYDKLFKNNYGFAWLGYFYNVYAMGEYKALLANVEIKDTLNKAKTQSWVVRFYGCWADDLCQIIDNIPASYENKDGIPKETWEVMKLNSMAYGYKARKFGDLNGKKYQELKKAGIIDRLTDRPSRIRYFATAPMPVIACGNILYKAAGLGKKALRKVLH